MRRQGLLVERLISAGAKEIQQLAKRRAAVGDGEFFFGMDFRKGPAQGRVEKVGVIAEAARSSGLVDDHAISPALHDGEHLTRFRQGDHADIVTGISILATQYLSLHTKTLHFVVASKD